MHGFTGNVLSCEERERLAQELFEARHARRLFVRAAALDGSRGSTLRGVPENRCEAFPGGAFGCGRSHRLPCMNFLLFSTEV